MVYATFPDRDSAEAIGRRVLEAQLAACVTYWEAGTMYRWEGEIEEGTETLALFKTAPGNRPALVDAVEDAHPYDVPCVLPFGSEGGNAAYASWIQAESDA